MCRQCATRRRAGCPDVGISSLRNDITNVGRGIIVEERYRNTYNLGCDERALAVASDFEYSLKRH